MSDQLPKDFAAVELEYWKTRAKNAESELAALERPVEDEQVASIQSCVLESCNYYGAIDAELIALRADKRWQEARAQLPAPAVPVEAGQQDNRVLFERWVESYSDQTFFARSPSTGDYRDCVINYLWKAWQAGQSAAIPEGAFGLLISPRRWTRAMSDAWHKNIPDTEAAFKALGEAALDAAAKEQS